MRDALDNLLPMRLEALFIELQGRKAESVRITVRVDAGHTITGTLLAYAEGQILLRDLSTGGGLDATYIPLLAVRAVTVHYLRAPGVVEAPAEGSARDLQAAVNHAHVPSRLDLKRTVAALQSAVHLSVDVDWEDWPHPPQAAVRLQHLLTELREALLSQACDASGRAVLWDEVDGVRILAGRNAPAMRREGRLLTVLCQKVGDDVQVPRNLRATLEKLL